MVDFRHGWKGLNLLPEILEIPALPVELQPYRNLRTSQQGILESNEVCVWAPPVISESEFRDESEEHQHQFYGVSLRIAFYCYPLTFVAPGTPGSRGTGGFCEEHSVRR